MSSAKPLQSYDLVTKSISASIEYTKELSSNSLQHYVVRIPITWVSYCPYPAVNMKKKSQSSYLVRYSDLVTMLDTPKVA